MMSVTLPYFRLLVGFIVIFGNLHACRVLATTINMLNKEINYTQNQTAAWPGTTSQQLPRPQIQVQYQQREDQQPYWDKPISSSAVNHNNQIKGASQFSASPSSFNTQQSTLSLQPLPQQRQPLGQAQSYPYPQQRHSQLPQLNEAVANDIASSVLRFAINVGSDLGHNAYFSKSEVFSPLCTMSALALLLAGAKGKSYQQLSNIFGFNLSTGLHNNPVFPKLLHQEFGSLLEDIENSDVQSLHHRNIDNWRTGQIRHNYRNMPMNQKPIEHIIKVANGIFTQTSYNLNPVYSDVVSTIYRSELDKLDFQRNSEAARQHINAWVSKNTFGRIPNIISNSIPQETKLILASALYFKGFWTNEFFQGATMQDTFFPEGEDKPGIKVQMMANGGVFPYYESEEFNTRIIGLPYRGNLTTMYIIQPKQSTRTKLKEFQDRITPEFIESLIGKMVYRTAIIAMPKMHIVRQLNMKDVLQRLGVIDIFSSRESDLSLVGDVNGPNYNQNINQNLNSNIYPSPPVMAHASNNQWSQAAVSSSGIAPSWSPKDRFNEDPLIFASRFGEIVTNETKPLTPDEETKTEEIEIEATTILPEITIKDSETSTSRSVVEHQKTTKNRNKRQTFASLTPLDNLEAERLKVSSSKSDLYVDEILHKVDIEINEHGTEAAAATVAVLKKSGPDVLFRVETPFLLLIRHDPSKLILFYGIINEPEL